MTGKEDVFHNRLFCMDCMELFPAVPDGCVSMILTDPPYGIRYQNHFTSRRHPKLAGDEGIDYERFAVESYRILKDNAHAYFFTRFDCYPHHYGCLEQAGFTVKNCLVVEKGTVGGIGDLQGSYASNAEWILFCQKGRRTFQHTALMENRKKEIRPQAGRNGLVNIRHALMPAGLGMGIQRQHTIPPGRKRTGSATRLLKMWSFYPG